MGSRCQGILRSLAAWLKLASSIETRISRRSRWITSYSATRFCGPQ